MSVLKENGHGKKTDVVSPRIKYLFIALAVVSSIAGIGLWPISVGASFNENGFGFLVMGTCAITSAFIAYCIHATHRIQKALQQAESVSEASIKGEQFIRTIIDSTPNMMGYWDKSLRCRYANNAFSDWFGVPPKELIGIRFQDLVSEQLFALNEPHIRAVLAGEPQRFERTLNKANGSVGHIIANYIPDFDADGTVRGFSIQSSEVTVLKETEAKLKLAASVFDNTLDGVLITDVNGTILSVNPGFIEITGYTAEDAVSQNPRILQSNRHDRAFYADIWTEIHLLV